jgi:3-phytase
MMGPSRFIVIAVCLILSSVSVANMRSSANRVAISIADVVYSVSAIVETAPVPGGVDGADDPAIWIHPSDPSQSTVIGTDKLGGLGVYNLAGQQLQYLADGKMNNVDLRYNFALDGKPVALVTAGNRTNNSIAIYRVDPTTRLLTNAAARTITPGLVIYGSCMYHSPTSGIYYVFLDATDGSVEQWELFASVGGQVDAVLRRRFDVGTRVEGCVADDEAQTFYIAEEAVGIWKYGAEPNTSDARVLVDSTGAQGHLTSNVEGLTIYYARTGSGYLIASSQGSDSFVIYQRGGNNAYVATFAIVLGNGIDHVSHTDGIDVSNVGLSSSFEQGMFVAQDGYDESGTNNFKLVRWQDIAKAVSPTLTIDTSWDPRQIGASPSTPSPTPSSTPSPTPSSTPSPTPSSTPSPTPSSTPSPPRSPTPTSQPPCTGSSVADLRCLHTYVPIATLRR